jgi:hypothetical protein
MLVIHLAADEFGLFVEGDGNALLRRLYRKEQEAFPIVRTNDPQPAAALSFV